MNSTGINIRHGFTVPAQTNLFELTRDIEAALLPAQRDLHIHGIAFHAACIIDQATMSNEQRPTAIIFDALQAYNNHVASMLQAGHLHALVNTNVAVLECPDKIALYLVVNTEHEGQIQALIEAGIGNYEPYWDEKEVGPRTLGVTLGNWKDRGEQWARAAKVVGGEVTATSVVIQVGDHLADPALVNDAQAVLSALPSYEDRVGFMLNSLAPRQETASPVDVMAFMDAMPSTLVAIHKNISTITLEDLTGVNQS